MADQGTTSRYTRRRVLTTTGVALGAAAVGAAGATAIASAAASTPVIEASARQRFANKVVLITGATSGIGRAAALMFAAEGGKVGFCGRRENLGAQVEQEIHTAGGEATYIRADVRAEDDVRHFVDAVATRYGGLDVCFNNAGITIQKPLHEYTSTEWDDVVNTNLRGNFLALKYEIPHLFARGGGTVVATASSNVLSTTDSRSAYTASKHGIVGLVNCAAFDYLDRNIRINTLIPGTTNTELVRRAAGAMDLPDAAWDAMAAAYGRATLPMKRMATPEEIALGALALAAPDFTYQTASTLVLDGGKGAHS